MKQRIYLLFLVFSFIALRAYCDDIYKDPFRSLLPQDTAGEGRVSPGQAKPGFEDAAINVQGVLWGSGDPQAIIDGEVYRVGDKLITIDASIFKIEDNVVFIAYGEKIFKIKAKKETAVKGRVN